SLIVPERVAGEKKMNLETSALDAPANSAPASTAPAAAPALSRAEAPDSFSRRYGLAGNLGKSQQLPAGPPQQPPLSSPKQTTSTGLLVEPPSQNRIGDVAKSLSAPTAAPATVANNQDKGSYFFTDG